MNNCRLAIECFTDNGESRIVEVANSLTMEELIKEMEKYFKMGFDCYIKRE